MRGKLLLVLVALAALLLSGFTPFTAVTNVCPSCKRPRSDVLVLTGGTKVWGDVVAQNDDYYVVERYDEYRAVRKSAVASMELEGKAGPANIGTGDQILLNNGIVLHGAILEEQKQRYFIIQVGTLKHAAWVSQIKSVHRGGKPYAFRSE